MKIVEINEKTMELTEQLTGVLEQSVRATHLFLSASEIDDSNTAHFTVRAKDGARGTAVIRVKSATDDSVYTDITVNVKSNPDELIAPYQTQTKLAYAYEKVDDKNGIFLEILFNKTRSCEKTGNKRK